MKTTLSLTSRLAKVESMRVWKKKDLPGGFKNPIVLSGVLEHNGEDDYLDQCPGGCNECDEVARVFPHATDPSKRTFICNGDYHSYPCEIEDVARFYYNPDRMAELLCKALECEGVKKCGDGKLWRLGHSRLKETQGREVVVITEFGADDAKSIKDEIGNENFLLIAAVIRNRPEGDDQFNRRLYGFDQLIRWKEDGELYCLLNEFELRLRELVIPKKRKKRQDRSDREDAVSEYLKKAFYTILSLPTWEERKAAMAATANAAKIGRELGIPKSVMNEIINTTGKKDMKESEPQFFYDIATDKDYFVAAEAVVTEKRYATVNLTAHELYVKIFKEVTTRKIKSELKGDE